MHSIQLFPPTIQGFDNVIEIALPTHNTVGSEVAMKELGRAPFFPNGPIDKYEIVLDETRLPSPSIITLFLLDLNGRHPSLHLLPYLRQFGCQSTYTIARIAIV
jgi:hypothetical protein